MTIRMATDGDARAVAEIQIRGWQQTYRGPMPDEFLDTLSLDDHEAMWRRVISRQGTGDVPTLWVAERDERLVGFVLEGRARDAGPGVGEVWAIYADPNVLGTGVGWELMAHATRRLREQGLGSAILWVVEGNQRARRFYERAGWASDGAVKDEGFAGVVVREVRYVIDLQDPA